MLILNDIHIGFDRRGGTTPASRESLRSYLFHSFGTTLQQSNEGCLLIAGDLFDSFEVSPRDWVDTFNLLTRNWLARDKTLILVAGNHDWSPKGARVSSFQMLCEVLVSVGRGKVTVLGIDQWGVIGMNAIIAHCSNQTIFEEKLAEMRKALLPGMNVFVHCNYENKFAARSDHSLNISEELARKFVEVDQCRLIFAHEHQAKTALGGGVVILGNQWPTSIADCLGNDAKFAHVMTNTTMEKIPTWRRDDELSEGQMAAGVLGYGEIDWRMLDGEIDPDGCQFIRVVGEATANEASDVVNAIATFRNKSSAYVIGNAVKVDGIVAADDLPASFEAASKFDVMDFIKKHLDADDMVVVEKLMKEMV